MMKIFGIPCAIKNGLIYLISRPLSLRTIIDTADLWAHRCFGYPWYTKSKKWPDLLWTAKRFYIRYVEFGNLSPDECEYVFRWQFFNRGRMQYKSFGYPPDFEGSRSIKWHAEKLTLRGKLLRLLGRG